jgi:hypothetical protein
MEDPAEVQFPIGDHISITLRVEESRDRILFTLLDDLPLDLGHGTAVEILVSELLGEGMDGPTHFVNCSIACSTV